MPCRRERGTVSSLQVKSLTRIVLDFLALVHQTVPKNNKMPRLIKDLTSLSFIFSKLMEVLYLFATLEMSRLWSSSLIQGITLHVQWHS